MLKNFVNCGSLRCRINRLIFLLFLSIISIYPIADACVDSQQLSLGFINYLNDPDDPEVTNELKLNNIQKPCHVQNASKHASQHNLALSQQTSINDKPACQIKKIQAFANNVKSSQIYFPVSSDLSPPVV